MGLEGELRISHLVFLVMALLSASGVSLKRLDSGQAMAHSEMKEAGLMFEWHDTKYLGAAHELAGILYVIMQVVNLFD